MINIINDILTEIELNASIQYTDVDCLFEEIECIVSEDSLTESQLIYYDRMMEELYINKGALGECLDAIIDFRDAISKD